MLTQIALDVISDNDYDDNTYIVGTVPVTRYVRAESLGTFRVSRERLHVLDLGQLFTGSEGIWWIKGHHADDCDMVKAMQAKVALTLRGGR